jgi:hypothetical protein
MRSIPPTISEVLVKRLAKMIKAMNGVNNQTKSTPNPDTSYAISGLTIATAPIAAKMSETLHISVFEAFVLYMF